MLYLVQHGDAVSKEQDPDRPLSPQGEADMKRIGDFLRNAGISVDRILHSGKMRARQSAEILAHALSESGEAEAITGINPNDAVDEFASQIQQYMTPTLIVGHLPFLSKLASLLVMGKSDVEVVAYQPGSIVCLQRLDSHWCINWMIRPELVK